MSVTVYLLLRPFSGRAALHEGGAADPRKLLRYARLYRRAAALVPVLERDGWATWFDGVNVAARHPDVRSRAAAEKRLAAVGIDPGELDVSDLSALLRGTSPQVNPCLGDARRSPGSRRAVDPAGSKALAVPASRKVTRPAPSDAVGGKSHPSC